MREKRTEQRRQELIQFVIDSAEDALKKLGIGSEDAYRAAVAVADMLTDQFGGQVITFPTDYRRKLEQRDAAIYACFDGANVADLAREHRMTERGMRKLLHRAQARLKATPAAVSRDASARFAG